MLQSWVGYFVLSFFFKKRSYVDIITVFKGENKDKRISQDVTFIITPFLTFLLVQKWSFLPHQILRKDDVP